MCSIFFFSSRRRHTRLQGDWSSDVCSSDLYFQRVCARPDQTTERKSGTDQGEGSAQRGLGIDPAERGAVDSPCGLLPFLDRSEERRVGKECRSRWSPYH